MALIEIGKALHFAQVPITLLMILHNSVGIDNSD